ncbi:MAG TPA: peptidase E [Candidatus Limnocylindrales bacterium]|nr:peptidase E [Candidatus Limnocylindrales bacterium]
MPGSEPRIVAFGGASLLPGSTDGPLHQHLLDLTGEGYPRICFLGTASGDDPASIAAFYGWFARRAQASHLGLFDRRVGDIAGFLGEHDLIYVGGGNTANMLAIWRTHGVDVALRQAWRAGVILAGPSAGAVCWFEAGTTDSFGPEIGPLNDGLGFLPGSFCPHYDSESSRRPRYEELVASGDLPAGYAADDGVGLVFSGTTLSEVVAAMPESRAFRLERTPGGVEETSIKPRLLRG